MSDKLVIVESPSKAKTIKKYLGDDYEVIASQGHIIDLPASKFGIDVEHNFKPEYITMRGKAKILNDIKKLAKGKKKIYLATDPDREGEAIAWHLKNALAISDSEKCRIEFHEITESAVNKAIKSPKKVDFDLVDAQQARRALDRIVGYKISPVLWKKVKRGLSAGRVQSVALKIIMDREREIRNFKPEEYWNLSAILKKEKSTKNIIAKFYGTEREKIELKTEKDTMAVVNKITGKDFKVIDIKTQEKRRVPAPPFTTSSLQQEAARKLGFTVKKTMQVAQKLYEAGHITYMRTDSVRISDEAIKMAKGYIIKNFGEKYYAQKSFKTGANAQDAHEAIRPTKLTDIDKVLRSLSSDEKRLLALILNRFLASQMSVAVYDLTKVVAKVDDYIFNINGSTIKFDGFMKLYIEGNDSKDSEEEESVLPEFEIGEVLKQKDLKYEQKFTEPPARYTEASLVKTLEEKGIGRPSTYAPTISTILDRLYIEKENKSLKPTELGEVVNELMENYFRDIVDVEFTKEMEEDLDKIASGESSYIDAVKEFYDPFMKNLEEVEDKIEKVKLTEEVSDVICENCGRNMVVKNGRFGKFLACPGFPECRNIKSIVQEVDQPCPKCGGKVIIKRTKTKRPFYVCENNTNSEDSKCDYISWTKPGAKVKAVGKVASKKTTAKKVTAQKSKAKKTTAKKNVAKKATKKTSKKK
ncbi:MAG: type I DNA topoisomerase [Clostridia bacterium]|nr:type I DNA topoisomerase [Clostridia bacterium]